MTAELIHAPIHCNVDERLRGTFAAVGNFDGVHLGHQVLLKEAVALAKKAGARPSAIMLDPHPRRVFHPDTPPFQLTDIDSKRDLLGSLGIEVVFALPFVKDLYSQPPEVFVPLTLVERLGVVGIITGADFQFGAHGAGTVAMLSKLSAQVGVAAHTVDPVLASSKQKYSSSSIRDALRDGEPEKAAEFLGRVWAVRGTVVNGRRLARTMAFPTANITLGDYVRPKFGVYVVTADTPHGPLKGVANIGVRPTVDGSDEVLEAHFFDFDNDLYSATIDVRLHHFIRAETKFDGIDALKAQIAKDCVVARAWHEKNPA